MLAVRPVAAFLDRLPGGAVLLLDQAYAEVDEVERELARVASVVALRAEGEVPRLDQVRGALVRVVGLVAGLIACSRAPSPASS